MKRFLLFVAQLAVLSQINADFLQEILHARPHDYSDICNYEANWALVPHPHDCHKFFVCANHIPEEYKCERNYYYDPLDKVCRPGTCRSTSDAVCVNGWVAPAPNNCHAFDICMNGVYERQECASGYYYDDRMTICRPIAHTAEHLCRCILPESTVVEHQQNCEHFYVCIGGQAIEESCPRGSYFDAQISACIYDVKRRCVQNSMPMMSQQEIEMLAMCERLGAAAAATTGELLFIADPNDCQQFFMCLNGRAMAKQCPDGFYFEQETKYCVQDTADGAACAAIRQAAKEKAVEAEKEAAEIQIQHVAAHEQQQLAADKPPVHLSLSYTHVKVEAERGNAADNVEIMHTSDLLNQPQAPIELAPLPPMPPAILKHEKNHPAKQANTKPQTQKKPPKKQQQQNSEHLNVNLSEEFQHHVKKPNFDKLSSKFISF